MKKRKILSLFLAIALITGLGANMAYAEDDVETENVNYEEYNDVFADEHFEETSDEREYPVHTEEISEYDYEDALKYIQQKHEAENDYDEYSDEPVYEVISETADGSEDDDPEQSSENEETGSETEESSVPLRSTSTGSDWNPAYQEAFGESYFGNFVSHGDGERLEGDTNALIIENTDLSLKGKNGLDFNLKRTYNNQGIGISYANKSTNYYTANVRKIFYAMNNDSDNSRINVACTTEDEFYMYIKDGFYVTQIDTSKRKSIVDNDNQTVYFYLFEDLYNYVTNDNTSIHLTYDSSVTPANYTLRSREDYIEYKIESTSILEEINISGGWQFVMPFIYAEESRYRTYNEGSTIVYEYRHNGLFRGLDDQMYSFVTEVELKKKNVNGVSQYTYNFYLHSNENNWLSYEGFYSVQTDTTKNFNYNFTVTDNSGLTYYFYTSHNIMDLDRLKIVAVKDDYDNYIVYNYTDGKLSQVIDTMDREINFTYETTSAGENINVSYYDEQKQETAEISYDFSETNEIYNGSILEGKQMYKFTFTNQEGESTEYYYRKTEQPVYEQGTVNHYFSYIGINPYQLSKNYNIERIIYPDGMNVDYEYTRLCKENINTGATRGLWQVADREYTLGTEILKQNSYEFSFDPYPYVIDNSSSGLVTKTKYDNYTYLPLEIVLSSTGEKTGDYDNITYTYDDKGLVTKVVYSTRDYGDTIEYSYRHKGVVDQEYHKHKALRINYSYFSKDKPSHIYYYEKYGRRYYQRRHIVNTLTADGKEIASTEIRGNDTLLSKTFYSYNTDGTYIKEARVLGDTNNNGTLDINDDCAESETTITYSGDNTTVQSKVLGVTDADSQLINDITTTTVYDMYGNAVNMTDGNNNTYSATFDMVSRPLTYTYPNTASKSVSYNIASRRVTLTDERGNDFIYEYDGFGNIVSVKRVNGNITETLAEYSYDNARRLTEKINYTSPGSGSKETYDYNIFDKLTEKKLYEFSGGLNNALLKYTEQHTGGNLSDTITYTAVNGEKAQKSIILDLPGRVSRINVQKGNSTLSYIRTYDIFDNVLTETDANNNRTTYTYGLAWKNLTTVTYPDNTSVSFGYDAAGRKISETDAMGNATIYMYDSADRVLKVNTPFDGTETGETKYCYDENSNVVGVKVMMENPDFRETVNYYDNMNALISTVQLNGENAGIRTNYTYDISGNMLSMISGLNRAGTNTSSAFTVDYTYDNFGRLISETKGNKTETYNAYDYAGNLLSKTDRNNNTTLYTYGIFGLLSETCQGDSKTYSYDDFGRMTSSSSTHNNVTNTKNYEYDGLDNITREYTGTFSQEYTYDNNSNITAYTFKEGNTTKNSINYVYNNMNRPTSETVNGKLISYGYNANGQLTSRSINGVWSSSYTYNNAGLLTGLTDASAGTYSCTYRPDGFKTSDTKPDGTTVSYTYDNYGRLTAETAVNGNNTVYENTYTYDLHGNRLSENKNGTDLTYHYTINNVLYGYDDLTNDMCTDFTYDDNGNLTEIETYDYDTLTTTNVKTFTYDNFNRLVSYTDGSDTTTYSYYADNLRASKTDSNSNTTAFVWNGQNLAYEKTGTDWKAYSYDPTGIAAVKTASEQKIYAKNPHSDVIGQISDTAGTLSGATDFTAFGELVSGTVLGFGYAGEYHDTESGYIYLRNRYYDPMIGRFITEDPAKDETNWYVYCGNNPVGRIDPNGLYDRDAAVQYALKWYNGTNSPTYERFDTVGAFLSSLGRMRGDCANFVSQCLVAGGLTMNTLWHYYPKMVDEWHGNNSIQKRERDMTSAWASAPKQYEFFSSDWAGYINGDVIQIWTEEGMKYNIENSNIQPGDLMYFAHKEDRIPHHATIITKVDENEIYYSAHTGSRKDEKLSDGHLDDEMVFIIRIRDDAINGFTK